MAWLAHRHLVHLLSASGFVCTQEGSVGQGVKGGLACNLPSTGYSHQIVSPHLFCEGGSRFFTSYRLFAYWPLCLMSGVSILLNP